MDIPASKIAEHFAALTKAFESAPIRPAIQACAQELRQAYAQNFANASAPNFGAWPPRKQPYPWPPLRKTGRLYAAATQQGAGGHVEEIGHRDAEVGVEKSDELPYTHSQNYGWPKTNLPPRPYIDVPGSTLDTCGEIIGDAVLEVLP